MLSTMHLRWNASPLARSRCGAVKARTLEKKIPANPGRTAGMISGGYYACLGSSGIATASKAQDHGRTAEAEQYDSSGLRHGDNGHVVNVHTKAGDICISRQVETNL